MRDLPVIGTASQKCRACLWCNATRAPAPAMRPEPDALSVAVDGTASRSFPDHGMSSVGRGAEPHDQGGSAADRTMTTKKPRERSLPGPSTRTGGDRAC
ncbi:hypothetical protein, partial [Xanthomonas sacchari]|uniref:hypothetical protein n=1 Tax=Xanthomonas sacchari TaxID=56458 RepID=UPI00225571D5